MATNLRGGGGGGLNPPFPFHGEYLNVCLLVRDEFILLSGKLILSLHAWMDKLKFEELWIFVKFSLFFSPMTSQIRGGCKL